ncbi:hydroxypyruvate isomerase family protein [Leifsonia sp. NCR5]|uniref:hydroxypyruvate isomerase family protein n=1 Tax=Leifsonia sp. NCR5 TaxID=1978342 RepID=UPI001C4E32C1|nr:TIM barrel protein [Leifsonia sp. NCR5]
MTTIAANLEWLFTETADWTADRIRAAAAHGLDAVEIWGWRDKDVEAIRAALDETGVTLLSLIVDPQLQLTDPSTHEPYLDGVRDSLEVAIALGAPNLVVVAGQELDGVPRQDQHDAVVSVLSRAAAIVGDSGVTLLLEPLNSRVDHVGTYLWSTREGLDIVREVGSPQLRLLLDAYHALVMGEDLAAVVGDDIALVGHVQVADAPGRHEPGTGTIDWQAQFRLLRDLGYSGRWGMEYAPSRETAASLRHVEDLAALVDGPRASGTTAFVADTT